MEIVIGLVIIAIGAFCQSSKYELYLPSEETLKAEVEKLANAQKKFAELTDGEQK